VNDAPTLFFFCSPHGLIQWDPLCPLLFVIVMEPLGGMIFTAVSEGLLIGFSVGTRDVGGFDISHLLFFIFSGADLDHLHLLQCLFLCFKVVLDLKIN
jgi:hypothetical protein